MSEIHFDQLWAVEVDADMARIAIKEGPHSKTWLEFASTADLRYFYKELRRALYETDLSDVSTQALIAELRSREGIKTQDVELLEICTSRVYGPAIVLIKEGA